MNKKIPILFLVIASITTTAILGSVENSYAGFTCSLDPVQVMIILNSGETSALIPKEIDCMGQVFTSVTTDISDCTDKGIDVNFASEAGLGGNLWTVDETITNTGGIVGEEHCDIIFNVNGGQASLTQQIWVTTSESFVIGGKILTTDSASLLLASTQSFSWMAPVLLSGIGIGLFVVSRKSENS